MNKLIILVTVLVLSSCASIGLDSANKTETATEQLPAGVNDAYVASTEYRIGVDDVVNVSVWKNPDLSVEVPVRPDGKISVPLVGDVEVGGKLPSEVSGIIKKKLSVYVRKPRVTVIIAEIGSGKYLSRVRVTGAVVDPQSFSYQQGMTVLDAVLEAGGVNKFASANKTMLYRKQGAKSQVLPVKLKNILTKGDLRTNYQLRPGDVLTIPERVF